MKYIAILLTVHNRKNSTLRCLQCLYAGNPVKGYTTEVWLTDDGCTDGTPEAVSTLYPEINIVTGDGNCYWNRGMYMAWQAAAEYRDYDYYLWLNDDTYIYPYFLYSLCRAAEFTTSRAIIVGATRDRRYRQITYGGWIDQHIITPNEELTQVDYFNGNIVLVPRVVFKRIGNLDYYFVHSKGDFDYGLRAKKAGFSIFQCGRFLGECERHSTPDIWCNPRYRIKQRLKAMYRPTGMPPHEIFHFDLRHYGFLSAIFHYCTVYLRCLCPKLWKYSSIPQL